MSLDKFSYNCYYEKIGKNNPIKLEDLPFEIPENWIWIRLKTCNQIVVGATPSTSNFNYWNNGTIPWLPSGCCQDSNIFNSYPKMKYITKEGYDSCSTKLMDIDTILIALTGATAGKVGILKFKACANQSVVGIKPYFGINTNFLFFQLMIRRKEILSDCIGSAQPHISKNYVENIYFALPPLVEQERIVKKIQSLDLLIQQYNEYETKLTKLESEFEEKIKKSILQYAIQGKLVKQDPNDEPASELIKKIYDEKQKLILEGKIKRDKYESHIYQGTDKNYYEKIGENEPIKLEDLPFKIPENWTWVRMKNVSNLIGGYAFKSSKFSKKGIRVIRISDFDEFGIKNNEIKRYPYSSILDKFKISIGNILLCMTGGTVGKSLLIDKINEDSYINQRVALLDIKNVNNIYVYNLLSSQYILRIIDKSKNSTNDNISMKLLEEILIPLPPLAEQERIVSKINFLFSLL